MSSTIDDVIVTDSDKPGDHDALDTALAREILFIFGAARSGTTFLNSFLFQWFGIGTGPEGKFVVQFAKSLKKYGPLTDSRNLRKLTEDIAKCEMLEIIRHRWPDDISFDVTPEKIQKEIPDPSYAGVVYAVFSCVAIGQNKPRIGNKFPGYWRHLPLLDSLFPSKAKYLAIVRDGRDVALSTMKTTWGERNSYSSAKEWARCIETIIEFQNKIGPERFLIIRYEDLLQQPEDVVQEISEFLRIELIGATYHGAVSAARKSATSHGVYKWRTEMSQRDRRRFETAAATHLALMNYDVEDPDSRITNLERCFLTLTDLAHKARRTMSNWRVSTIKQR